MPHATASWLVDTTALSFEQIAEFCGLHILEVQAMADDLASSKYTGRDPVRSGELTMAEIERGQADPNYSLKMQKAPAQVSRTKGPRYTPVSKRQDKPDGIAWILRNHPEITDAQVAKSAQLFTFLAGLNRTQCGTIVGGELLIIKNRKTILHETQIIPIPVSSPLSLEQWAAFSLRYITAWANWRVAWRASVNCPW